MKRFLPYRAVVSARYRMLLQYRAAAFADAPSRANLVALLRRLHESGLVFRGHMRLYPKLDEYLGLAAAPALTLLRREGEKLRPILESGWGPARPCHIDPAPHNFIVAGRQRYLVDREYSAMCEPLWDLAGLSIEGEFDAGQDVKMLAAYFGNAERVWASRLHLYKIMLRLLRAHWPPASHYVARPRIPPKWTARFPAPSPPRCSPLPPEPLRILYSRTRNGYAYSSASAGVFRLFVMCVCTPLKPSRVGRAPMPPATVS